MKLQFSLVLIVSFFLASLHAQINLDNFSPKDYTPGTQKISSLSFNFQERVELDDDVSIVEPVLYSQYEGFFNFDRHQTQLNLSAGLSNGDFIFDNPWDNNNFFGNFSLEHRRYLSDRIYVPVSLGLTQNANINGSNSNTSSYSLGAGIGVGRINIINEIATAERFIEKLESNNLLNRALSNDELVELAAYIRSLKNNRFISNRGDIESEYHLLKAKLANWNVLTDTDESNTLLETVKESYQFEPMINRSNGTRLSLTAHVNKVHFSYDGSLMGIGDIAIHQDFYSANLSYEKENYINHKFQWNYGLAATVLNTANRTFQEPNFVSDLTSLSIAANTEFNYLPEANKLWSLGIGASYIEYLENPFPVLDDSNYSVNLSLGYEQRIKRNLSFRFGLESGYSSYNKFNLSPTLRITF